MHTICFVTCLYLLIRQIMKIPITFASKLNATHLANVKNTWCTWAAKSLELLVSDLVCDVRHSKSAQYALLVTVEKSKIKTGFAEKMEILTKIGVDELVAEFNKDPNIPTARRAEKSPTTGKPLVGGESVTLLMCIEVTMLRIHLCRRSGRHGFHVRGGHRGQCDHRHHCTCRYRRPRVFGLEEGYKKGDIRDYPNILGQDRRHQCR